MLQAESVSLRLGGRQLLHDVSLQLSRGELHALLGPNGAGKSTALAVLAGDVRLVSTARPGQEPRSASAGLASADPSNAVPSSADPSSAGLSNAAPSAVGRVRLDGRELADWSHRELARARAVLTQQHTVSFPFTVREVVRLGRHPWAGSSRAADDTVAVDAALAATEMLDQAEQSVTTLSGGELARVALARTLAQDTDFVLLDEPTAALDLRHQEQTLQLARALATDPIRPRGVLVVLHDLNLAAAYADQVTLLDAGHVVGNGSPSEVFTPELLGRVYRQAVERIDRPGRSPLIMPLRQHESGSDPSLTHA